MAPERMVFTETYKKRIQMSQLFNINLESYKTLANIQRIVLESDESNILLDFSKTEYIDAIYMAFIGGMRELSKSYNKKVSYRIQRNTKLYNYFKNSGLYEYFKHGESYISKNSIPFSEIHMEEESIVEYINRILSLAPINLSSKAESYLFTNIYEIFSNSSDHSEAQSGVYACGHWMPTKKQLEFSVYDTGIGIPTVIKKHIDSKMTSAEALRWALTTGNSTKQLNDGVPRGVGLPNLLDFIGLNNGSLYILSNDIYYSYENGNERFIPLGHSVIGTMISFIIISDNDHIYKLQEE